MASACSWAAGLRLVRQRIPEFGDRARPAHVRFPGSVPRFTTTTAAAPPATCANGATAATSGDIALLSSDLRFPQYARASAAYDRTFGDAWVASIEGMYTRAMSTFFYTNLALVGPQGADRNGRVVYGTIATTVCPAPRSSPSVATSSTCRMRARTTPTV